MFNISTIEEVICHNQPAFEEFEYDGWRLRFTPGYSNHNNSVWPFKMGQIALDKKVEYCEKAYRERELPCSFRLPQSADHQPLEHILQKRGYEPHNPNLVMVRQLGDIPKANIILCTAPEWIEAIFRIHPTDDPELIRWNQEVLSRLDVPSWFGLIERDEDAVGYGRGIMANRIVTIRDLWILPSYRGKGLGTELINGLLIAGKEAGATSAVIGVNESNTEAHELYKRLGYEDLYEYQYWILLNQK